MLIRLIPPAPEPTVLFTLTFPPLPADIPFPQNWAAQLQHLSAQDLELPGCIHALDVAVGLSARLHEVVFDLNDMSVSCTFVDGVREVWGIDRDTACLAKLRTVVEDVCESAGETPRQEPKLEPTRMALEPAAPTPVKPTKHKKQRSLLMTLVACVSFRRRRKRFRALIDPSRSSLVPSSSCSSSRSVSPSPPPSPPLVPPAPPPTVAHKRTPSAIEARNLRRRARSTLVDVFRRHVLTVLSARAPSGGYAEWVARSMVRRAEHMLSEELAWGPEESPERSEGCQSGTSDDTDGSSVHTPEPYEDVPSAPPPTPASPSVFSSPPPTPFLAHRSPAHSRNPSFRLRTHIQHLRAAIGLTTAHYEHMKNTSAQILSMLEVRSRRRAWSCKTLQNGPQVGLGGLGLAMPVRRSGLARCLAVGPAAGVGAMADARGEVWGAGELFPVSEESSDSSEETFGGDDDDEFSLEDDEIEYFTGGRADDREYDLEAGGAVGPATAARTAREDCDLEAGRGLPLPLPMSIPLQRTKRSRNTSQPRARPLNATVPRPRTPSIPRGMRPPSLCRPIASALATDEVVNEKSVDEGEFTLAMSGDLPFVEVGVGRGQGAFLDDGVYGGSERMSRCAGEYERECGEFGEVVRGIDCR